uniref:Uncharacterized protein n=1 Tax=Physcomitrium patens TaxID=3218 RepID=A0A2K1LAL2_PHYPA|nr:hypothetical protein PHYPA_001491 [Physcomitrium patens]
MIWQELKHPAWSKLRNPGRMASGIVAKDRKANWTRFCNFTTHNIKFSAVGLLDHGQWNC